MPTTSCDLYRSLIGDAAKLKVRRGNPDAGMLDPRWTDTSYTIKSTGEVKTSRADVKFVVGAEGPEVAANGKGTSLHDVSGWFPGSEFWIPNGTEYSDEIKIVKDTGKDKKTNPKGTVSGFHYQLAVRTQMTQEQFSGYLNNFARAAVVRQNELAKGKV